MEAQRASNIPPYNLLTKDDENSYKSLYELIDLFGGGKLVTMMEDLMKSNKSFDELDQFMKRELPKFMYSRGEGVYVPKEELVLERCTKQEKELLLKEKEKEKERLNKKKDYKESTLELGTKFICSNLEKRGKIGETLLHLCLLNGTPVHRSLAKRLIKAFPNLLNDIFISNDYYGQTALHLAIVNEDLEMVRFLLSHGASIHERNCGKFFCTEDQRPKRKNTLRSEWPELPKYTNYKGISYFGEYPLSVAASLNQIDCVRLLLAYNADPSKQDSNGNTALHMSVIHNNLEVFKLLMESDVENVAIRIKNNQEYTPLTLAVKMAKKEFFDYVNEKLRKTYFIYGDISCAAYYLKNIDSIKENGDIDLKCALHLVFGSEDEEHLEFLEGFLVDLLTKKWRLYIKFRFYIEVIFFLVYFVLTGVTILLKRLFFDSLSNQHCLEHEEEFTALSSECKCAYLMPKDNDRYFRTILEIIIILYSLGYVIININEFYVQRLSYGRTLMNSPSKISFLFSNICILLIVPMRFMCMTYGEDVLVVLAIIFMATYCLHLGRGFPYMATFVFVIYKVLKTNFFRFFIIYAIFIMGYSQSFYIVYDFGHEPVEEVFNSPLQSIFDTLVLSVGDILIPYNNLLKSKNSAVGKFLLATYLVTVTLLLVNILIAMMFHTYDHTFENKNEWLRQWGKHVLSIEESLAAKERKKQKKNYTQKSEKNEDDEDLLVMRWRQTIEERIENYESTSTEFKTGIFNSNDIDNGKKFTS